MNRLMEEFLFYGQREGAYEFINEERLNVIDLEEQNEWRRILLEQNKPLTEHFPLGNRL